MLRAAEKLTLACGWSAVKLSPDGVKIRGKRIADGAGDSQQTEVKGKGPRLTLAEDAQLCAPSVRVFSTHAEARAR